MNGGTWQSGPEATYGPKNRADAIEDRNNAYREYVGKYAGEDYDLNTNVRPTRETVKVKADADAAATEVPLTFMGGWSRLPGLLKSDYKYQVALAKAIAESNPTPTPPTPRLEANGYETDGVNYNIINDNYQLMYNGYVNSKGDYVTLSNEPDAEGAYTATVWNGVDSEHQPFYIPTIGRDIKDIKENETYDVFAIYAEDDDENSIPDAMEVVYDGNEESVSETEKKADHIPVDTNAYTSGGMSQDAAPVPVLPSDKDMRLPSLEGYTFLGWSLDENFNKHLGDLEKDENGLQYYTDEHSSNVYLFTPSQAVDGTFAADGSIDTKKNENLSWFSKPPGRTTLYAVWQSDQYEVRYHANGGAGSVPEDKTGEKFNTYGIGDDVTLLWPKDVGTENKLTLTDAVYLGWTKNKTQPAIDSQKLYNELRGTDENDRTLFIEKAFTVQSVEPAATGS